MGFIGDGSTTDTVEKMQAEILEFVREQRESIAYIEHISAIRADPGEAEPVWIEVPTP